MSIEAMAWAFRQEIPNPGAKLVLLALCDFADESWSCFPGQRTLAGKTSQGERTVRRHLDWLEQQGYIVSRARFADGRRTSNRYTIHVPRPQTPPPSGASDPGTEKRAKQAARSASGQSGQRPDPAGEAARLAGEPSENHQTSNPQPPPDGDGRIGSGCAAHPRAPVANCRGCGTNPRGRRQAAAEADTRREKAEQVVTRNRQWFEEERAHRAQVARQEAQGALDGPRRAAREELRRARREAAQPSPSVNDT